MVEMINLILDDQVGIFRQVVGALRGAVAKPF